MQDHAEQIRRHYPHTVEDAADVIERAERIVKLARALQAKLPKQADLPPPMIAVGDPINPITHAGGIGGGI